MYKVTNKKRNGSGLRRRYKYLCFLNIKDTFFKQNKSFIIFFKTLKTDKGVKFGETHRLGYFLKTDPETLKVKEYFYTKKN